MHLSEAFGEDDVACSVRPAAAILRAVTVLGHVDDIAVRWQYGAAVVGFVTAHIHRVMPDTGAEVEVGSVVVAHQTV